MYGLIYVLIIGYVIMLVSYILGKLSKIKIRRKAPKERANKNNICIIIVTDKQGNGQDGLVLEN